jgi:hypothetical protein
MKVVPMKVTVIAGSLLMMAAIAFPLGAPEGASGASGGGGTQLITMLATYELIMLLPTTLLGLIPAAIASRKGRKFGRWWVYGWLLFIIALIHSLSIKGRKCPYCAEQIRPEAKVCRFCGRDLA